MLPADQNKNTGGERQDSHDDCRNDDGVNEQAEPGEDEIDSEQEHTKIFRNVNHVCLSLGEDVDLSRRVRFVTPKVRAGLALTDQELFREIRVIRHFCCSRGLKFLL